MDNPGCAVCHDVMDPIAAGFQNWPMNNRFRPNGAAAMAHALDNTYMSTNYMNDAKGNEFYQPNDNWYRDAKAPRLWQHADAERVQQPEGSRVAGRPTGG